jgi:hypothetical protein
MISNQSNSKLGYSWLRPLKSAVLSAPLPKVFFFYLFGVVSSSAVFLVLLARPERSAV